MTDRVDEARPDASEQQTSLIRLLALLVRKRRLLIGLPLVAAIAALLVSLVLPERYTVEARFTPEYGRSGASTQLLGLASQFGVSLGGLGDNAESLDFYAELLESRELLRTAALTTYTFTDDDGRTLSGHLIELFDIEADTEAEAVFIAVNELDDLLGVRADPGAGIIIVEVSSPWPALSVALGQRLLELVNEFNLERRQTRASAERAFLESRVKETEHQLRTAEAELQQFLMENRRFQDPQLAFQQDRLEREVDRRQQMYTGLVQNLEQARLEEVRNTPVITVLDQPRMPAEQTAPNFVLNVALGLLIGALLAFAVVVGTDVAHHARASHPREFADLESAAREALGPLARRTRSRSGRP